VRETKIMTRILVVLMALAAVACDSSCEQAGRTYEDGDVWTCSDGCNSCGCTDGQMSSTGMACSEPPAEGAGQLQCNEGGVWHAHGHPWTCSDGCSVCTCDDGQLSKQSDGC
jgi:hypothetical protein